MSMIGNFRLATDPEIETLLADPESITELLYPDEEPSSDGIQLDVDKAWHGIHFLLTGDAWEGEWPLSFILAGGRAVGDVDVGYGPARVFTSNELHEISEALAPLTSDMLSGRYNATEFEAEQIYPDIWDEDPGELLDEYLLFYYEKLKEFLAAGAARGRGLIVYLN